MKMRKLFYVLMVMGGLPGISFALQAEGVVGPRGSLSDSTPGIPLRLTKDGSLANQESHGRYQEASYRGNLNWCSNQAYIAATSGLTNTPKNLTLWNPTGSGKNLVINEIIGVSSASAVTPEWYVAATSSSTTTAPATATAEKQGNAYLGNGSTALGQCFNTAT